MNLLGVEFKNYACFDHQFVPIRPGMNLLVGPNNAGKTALLRGLSSLHALPIHDAQHNLPIQLSGYSRAPNDHVTYEVLASIDQSDSSFIKSVPENLWERLANEGLVRWRFMVQSNTVSFGGCTIALPNLNPVQDRQTVLNLISGGAGSPIINKFVFPTYNSAAAAQIESFRYFAPDHGPLTPFNDGEKFVAPFHYLVNVRLISPHRVVQNRNQLQTVLELPSDAQSLAPFLMTLHGRDRDAFEYIESFVTKVFPEFKHINPVAAPSNQLYIDLTETATNRRIPLENCGTGVEQILTLATFVLTTPKPGLVLLDEPHSYLHPSAERELVQFLETHSEHSYVITTHSAVLMNSVHPDRITYVRPPGRPFTRRPEPPKTSQILFDLGYRNSDALFNDRLIFVEGQSDKEILPILLLKDGEIDPTELNRTGLPILEGVGKGSTALQTSILRYEKLLAAIGRADQPRIYVFDGDRAEDEKNVLQGTTNPFTNQRITTTFLMRTELENYLLVSEAISAAIGEELTLKGVPNNASEADVKASIEEQLQSDDQRLFPLGKRQGEQPILRIKGSRALERIYGNYGLPYNKIKSGALIAKYISAKNQPALSEITALVRTVFS